MVATGNTDYFGRTAMEGRKMGRFGRITYAGLAMALVSTPAFAQEAGGLEAAPPPPPPPPPPAAPVRVGGNIRQPTKVKDVKPVYPAIAQSARVQGVVIIEATIGPNGAVQEAKVLRSIPLLDAAALEAVRQWQFTPTMLNGVPVPVIMTVTVNFTLQ